MKPELNTTAQIKPRNFDEIVVTITIPDYEPMIFRLARKLSDEVRKDREQFYGLSLEEQNLQTREFRTMQLSRILLECPENVPGVEYDGDWRQQMVNFLNEYPEFVTWIWGEYQAKLYPKEILLSLSV